jgi:hypothetical protein
MQRLMWRMGIAALGPKPRTTKPAPGHKIFPYLLRDLAIDRPNQVWAADITYIPIGRGFLYLVAVIDWASRAVLAWRLSNTMDVSFCVSALEAVRRRLDEHPEKMRQRRETVEHPFGTIKARMGATHFLMNTLPRVAAEMALHVLAYNLTRVMNIMGVQPLLTAMRAQNRIGRPEPAPERFKTKKSPKCSAEQRDKRASPHGGAPPSGPSTRNHNWLIRRPLTRR